MDPRVERTRHHVLNCARTVLAEQGTGQFTFSSVSAAARVARQTLYRLWGTPEQLLADLLLADWAPEQPRPVQATPAAHLKAFLLDIREHLSSPMIAGTLASVMSHATIDTRSADTLSLLMKGLGQSLRAGWGPLPQQELTLIIGPVVFQMLAMRRPVTDNFIAAIVTEAMTRRLTADPETRSQHEAVTAGAARG